LSLQKVKTYPRYVHTCNYDERNIHLNRKKSDMDAENNFEKTNCVKSIHDNNGY